MNMKMQNVEIEFVAFDAQDVIATSGPLGKPLAFAQGQALILGEEYYSSNGGEHSDAVDALDYDGEDAVRSAIDDYEDMWFEITSAEKSGDGYGVRFNTDWFPNPSESIGGAFDSAENLHTWLAEYLDTKQ